MARRKRSQEDLKRMRLLTSQETPTTRVCTICLTIKLLSEFPKKLKMRKGVSSSCKECENETRIRSRFNIDMEDYKQMLAQQLGRCAICGSLDPKYGRRRFHIDHDHTNHRIRGLLCSDCNTGIGLFKDNYELLLKAITYLSTGENANVSKQ